MKSTQSGEKSSPVAQNCLSAGNPAAVGEGSRAEPTAGTASTGELQGHRDRGVLTLAAQVCSWGLTGTAPSPSSAECAAERASIPAMTQPSPSHRSPDKGCSCSQSQHSSSTPGLLSLPFCCPPCTYCKWEIPLPPIPWEKPAHGNSVLHNINLADRRITALPLILLHSLPEQTMQEKVSCKEGGKNKKNKNIPQLRLNKSGMQNTTQSKQKKTYLTAFQGWLCSPQAQSESLQIAAAWLWLNAGQELHRNHNKRWKGCSQKWIFFFSLHLISRQ